MGLDDDLRVLAESRNNENPLEIGVNSHIASLYNLSRCPIYIGSGIDTHCQGRVRMLGALRDMVLACREGGDELTGLVSGTENDQHRITYGDVLRLFETAQVPTEMVSQWVEEMLCVADHEYAAVRAGYPHLHVILDLARDQWCSQYNKPE